MASTETGEQRVLILAPRGRDAEVVAGVLRGGGIDTEIVGDCDALLAAIESGAAAAAVSEEALAQADMDKVAAWLARQAPWSDFPFVMLLAKQVSIAPARRKAPFASLGNVVLLERPLSVDTLAAASASALRARRKQYEAREVLAQREAVAHELALLNEHLEARVGLRTQELAQVNDRLTTEVMKRERAQQAVLQAQKLEALGRLTGGVAHDFNNVLSIIQGNMELVSLLSREADTKARANAAKAACQRGARLTAQLLTFARSQTLDLRPLAVTSLFDDVVQLAKPILGPNIEFIHVVDENVDGVLADAGQLEMALLNLAINARDAMDGKGRLVFHASLVNGPPALLPAGLADGAYVRIAVSDNGTGMSPEVAAKVFEPFFTTKGVGKGTGLGLSQVYGMAQQSGGDVVVHTVQGQGTAIELWLHAAERAASTTDSPPPDRQVLTGLKVVLVEDDDAVRAGMVDALMALGCAVTQAAGGAQGLAALTNARPDLLLTDYLMPEMTGVELAIRARASFPDLPILIATGYADMEAIEGAIGADAILRKPFELSELGAAVARVVKAARTHPA